MSLNNATSPYLLAHKDNPIQWRTWGPQALAEAKAADKPILLSLGYVGCHWCQVMNRETFSDAAAAQIVNDNFIPVLADRDERPDLDMLYQGAAGLMGHPGGWPLNIFLTPDGRPYWVAGYLPKDETPETPNLSRLATDTAALWKNERPRAEDTGNKVREAVENLYNRDMTAAQESMNLDLAALRIAQRHDIFFGGLQNQVKFPNPFLLQVIWNAYLRTGTPQFSQIIFTTLDSVLMGGVYDHVGGGFFRHSLDERWLDPAFEKMLYDQALLIDFCTQVFQFNRNELCRQRVTDTLGFLFREMKVGDLFAASISSGSQTEDGKYYTWSEAEIDAALVGTFSARFKQVYGITRDGNVMGRNLPRRLGNPAPANEADEALLVKQRDMLLALRQKRTAPLCDDRVLTDWNGLMIAALARAGQVFERPDWTQAAIKAFDAVIAEMGGKDNTLSHVKGSMGIADDYADMARAALLLHEATADGRFLTQARAWTAVLDTHFWNGQINGYCYYADNAEQLFVRPRMVFDNPNPSANGTMLEVLTRLALLTGEPEYMGRASTLAATFGNEANRMLNGAGSYLAGFEYLVNSLIILVIGHKGHSKTQELIRAYWSKALPNAMLVQIEPGDSLPAQHPANGRGMEGGHPTVYICQAGQCSNPITNAQELALTLTLPPQLRAQVQAQIQQQQAAPQPTRFG
ncbi:MAG TPA: thioredoxin domain-containing protein [Rhizomicrobium sp.]|nr:thioredoxin domain-containing protein [Rhizomicrobium sp.]